MISFKFLFLSPHLENFHVQFALHCLFLSREIKMNALFLALHWADTHVTDIFRTSLNCLERPESYNSFGWKVPSPSDNYYYEAPENGLKRYYSADMPDNYWTSGYYKSDWWKRPSLYLVVSRRYPEPYAEVPLFSHPPSYFPSPGYKQ